MDGIRHSVIGADGTRIGLLTAGTGSALLLIHGGMGRIERWEPLWKPLAERWRVTAMDRRGRGSSGDGPSYRIGLEFRDITAVAVALAAEQGSPIDVFGHSYGATCALGAAAGGAPFRRMVLYEPPGPATVSDDWIAKINELIGGGMIGRAVVSFLTEISGLTREQVAGLRDTPGTAGTLPIAAATMRREVAALATADLASLAAAVTVPVLLLLGAQSPAWAGAITRELAEVLPEAEFAVLPDSGHDAIDTAPDQLEAELVRFLS